MKDINLEHNPIENTILVSGYAKDEFTVIGNKLTLHRKENIDITYKEPMKEFKKVYVVIEGEENYIQGVYSAKNKNVVKKAIIADFEMDKDDFSERFKIEELNLIEIK